MHIGKVFVLVFFLFFRNLLLVAVVCIKMHSFVVCFASTFTCENGLRGSTVNGFVISANHCCPCSDAEFGFRPLLLLGMPGAAGPAGGAGGSPPWAGARGPAAPTRPFDASATPADTRFSSSYLLLACLRSSHLESVLNVCWK